MSDEKKGRDRWDVSRRRFVQGLGLTTGGLMLAGARAPRIWAASFGDGPFTTGVASGDPDHHSVVLWTRVAPDPLNGGGIPANVSPVVRWEVATDPQMQQVIQHGTTLARGDEGHSVRVVVEGLPEDRWYWYRFHAFGEASEIGRTRTFPAPGSDARRMRFAVASCQNYEAGFWSAYADIARQDLDFVCHTGDYIYEGAATSNPLAPRTHNGSEIVTAEDYRNRYALYRLDPALREAHRNFPWIVTWDDHEVDNNYAGDIPEVNENDPAQTVQQLLARRAAAYQVYYESMPLRPERRPSGPDMTLYRNLVFGDLASINVLDTRQFRSDQACGDGLSFCPEAADPTRTMTGAMQEAWLFDKLENSRATWNIMAQQVMFMKWDLGALFGIPGVYNLDAWDGYSGARQRIQNFLAEAEIRNTVVLTGDIHSSWASDLKQNFDDPASPTIGAEFVCSSISSSFGDDNVPLVLATLPSNPHIKYFDGLRRGYSLCEVTGDRWRTDVRAVADVLDPDSAVTTQASFVVENGVPGVVPA